MNIQSRNSVLVTGAGGFIGRAARKLLHRSGYSVLSLDQPPPAKSGASQWSIGRQVLLDITDAEQLQRLFEARKIEAIIHLAAILPTAAQQEPARATEVNIQGSLNLVEMARKFGVRRFVFGSSLSVLWNMPGGASGRGVVPGCAGRSLWCGEALRRAPWRGVSPSPRFGVHQSADWARCGTGGEISFVGMEESDL